MGNEQILAGIYREKSTDALCTPALLAPPALRHVSLPDYSVSILLEPRHVSPYFGAKFPNILVSRHLESWRKGAADLPRVASRACQVIGARRKLHARMISYIFKMS